MSFRATVDLLRRTVAEAAEDRITTNAASLAFHLTLALFPALLAAVGFVHLVGTSPAHLQSIVHAVRVLLPVQMAQIIDEALRTPSRTSSGVLELVVGLVVALWSSIEAMASLQIGLDVAYEVDEDRGFVGRRLMSLPMVGLTVLLGGAASALVVLGNPIRSLLPNSFVLARSTADAGWDLLRWAGACFLVILLLSAYYRLGTNAKGRRRRWLNLGAICAAGAWLAASLGFSFYLDHFGHESRTYGTFAGVAVMLLWFYLTGAVVLLGAELNCELDRNRAHRAAAADRSKQSLAPAVPTHAVTDELLSSTETTPPESRATS